MTSPQYSCGTSLEHSHRSVENLVSSLIQPQSSPSHQTAGTVQIVGRGRVNHAALCWNCHHSCSQVLAACDSTLHSWDTRTAKSVPPSSHLNTLLIIVSGQLCCWSFLMDLASVVWTAIPTDPTTWSPVGTIAQSSSGIHASWTLLC